MLINLILRILIFINLITGLNIYAQNPLEEVRKKYKIATADACKAENIIDYIHNLRAGEANAKYMAYLGSAEALMANCVSFPHRKLSYFNEGREHLDKAIASAPEDYEIRFLRMQVQLNAPDFLNYNDQIVADRKVIFSSLNQLLKNDDINHHVKYIALSLKQTLNLNVEEDKIVNKILNN